MTPFNDSRIAYFSMEITLNPAMPTYSGGLGILAGDTLRSAADLGVHMVAVTLLHRKGYFRQHVDDNSELYHTNPTDREADIIRYAALNDAGFTVGVGWEKDLWSLPPAVLTMIRAARRAAAEGLPIVLHSAGCPWSDPLPSAHRRLQPSAGPPFW